MERSILTTVEPALGLAAAAAQMTDLHNHLNAKSLGFNDMNSILICTPHALVDDTEASDGDVRLTKGNNTIPAEVPPAICCKQRALLVNSMTQLMNQQTLNTLFSYTLTEERQTWYSLAIKQNDSLYRDHLN